MVQRKKQTKSATAVQVVKPNPVPVAVVTPERTANYPVLSFILFVAALLIWFFVGRMFMEMAVNENLCHIRYSELPKPSGEVVAVVDGKDIYLSEVRDYADTIPQLADLPFEMVYPQLLETIVNARMLNAAAVNAGTERLPAVQRALKMAQDQIIAQAYVEHRLKELATDERLQALYQQEIQKFKPVDEVRARHILLRTEKEARDVLIQLKAGADFTMLAEKYSQDTSNPDGDLGYFTEEMMIPEFGKTVFALRIGQLSEPIKTPFGWHVVQVEDRRQSEPPSFEDSKDDLRRLLMEQDLPTVLAEEREKMAVQILKPTLQ